MQYKDKQTNSPDTNQDTQTLGEIAYTKVLDGLFSRKIKVGSFVSQASLVETLDVPVQPLREALRLLESEGILVVHPRSGIEFIKPDLELARSTFQFRTIIERTAARHTATAGDVDHFSEIAHDHEAIIKLIEGGEFGDDVLAANESLEQRLHNGMLETLANPLIAKTTRGLNNYMRLIELDGLVTPPLVLQSLNEHMTILQAIIIRDADAAEDALILHFQLSLQRSLRMF